MKGMVNSRIAGECGLWLWLAKVGPRYAGWATLKELVSKHVKQNRSQKKWSTILNKELNTFVQNMFKVKRNKKVKRDGSPHGRTTTQRPTKWLTTCSNKGKDDRNVWDNCQTTRR